MSGKDWSLYQDGAKVCNYNNRSEIPKQKKIENYYILTVKNGITGFFPSE